MRISCVVTCYNQEETIQHAVLSLVNQSRPPDQILIADDGSTDVSRQLIQSMANAHEMITPIFRERNLGVTVNRDLALRQADGDFVSTLDGDDYHLPEKLAAECAAIKRTSTSIAYSDQRILHVGTGASNLEKLASFGLLGKKERMRWVIANRTHIPRDMLLAKDLHMKIGGYRSAGEPYEDWDFKIRLAATSEWWAYSGVEGVVHRLHSGGISQIPFSRHGAKRLVVIRSNRDLIREEIGTVYYYSIMIWTVAWASKWQAKSWQWQAQNGLRRLKANL